MKSKSENNSKLLKLILLILNNTQFLVTFLTLISILYLHSIHSIYFSIGTLISTFSGKISFLLLLLSLTSYFLLF